MANQHLSLNILLKLTLCLVLWGCTFAYEEKDGKIRIELIRQKTPHEQYLHAQNYYGLDLLDDGPKPGPRTNDSINLFRYLDNEFYGEVVVGKPGKIFNVAFDTAWSLSWLISEKCDIFLPECKIHNRYDDTKSSYYKPNGTKFSLNEGTYSFSGFFSYENISIAHSNVTGFLFVEMTKFPSSLAFTKADGVLGLGIQDSNENYEPFFYALMRQKKIKDPIFSIYLNRNPLSPRGGNVMLGYVEERHIHKNPDKVPDTIKYLPVHPGTDYWMFSVDKIILTLDSKKNTTLCQNGCMAFADTSTNAIEGPSDEIAIIHDRIKARKQGDRYYVNCDSVRGLDKVDFVLGGQYFRLNGPQYIVKMSNLTNTVCLSAFVPSPDPNLTNTWVLGGAFLAQFYSIYNVEDRTIGFVRAS